MPKNHYFSFNVYDRQVSLVSHTKTITYGECDKTARPTAKSSGSRTEQRRDSRKLHNENLVAFYRIL